MMLFPSHKNMLPGASVLKMSALSPLVLGTFREC